MYILGNDARADGSFAQNLRRTEDFTPLSSAKLIHDTATEVDNFVGAVLEGRDTNTAPEEALDTHLVCFAGQRALVSGDRVKVRY